MAEQNNKNNNMKVVILGGGPAGLAAGKVLTDRGRACVVLEKDEAVGGLSRTHSHHGFLFDLGGHRFFTKQNELDEFIRHLMVDELIEVDRSSKIYFLGKYFNYPPTLLNAFRGLGPVKSARIMLSFLKEKIRFPRPDIVTLEDWMISQFGKAMYEIFFKHYTEKVWGIPCSHGSAVWAAQRIKGMSLVSTLRETLLPSGRDRPVSLIPKFSYPAHGIGRISARLAQETQKHNQVRLESRVDKIIHDGSKIKAVQVCRPDGERYLEEGTHFFSSIPVTELVQGFEPKAPKEVIEAAQALRYRDLLIVVLMFDVDRITDDTWIYIPDPRVRFGRLHEPTNWSPAMSPPGKTSLVFEYFCFESDPFWSEDDKKLADDTLQDFKQIRLAPGMEGRVIDSCVVRARKAYPMHELGHEKPLEIIKNFVTGFSNLTLIGRYGMFIYNNLDHSMETGIRAALNLLGAKYDLEQVLKRDEYLEVKYDK
jgi:protoporphyrinogen oxidase